MPARKGVGFFALREWEVWHTYSTYFTDPIDDLHGAARKLVEAGAALCAVHRDGTAHWRSAEGNLRSGRVEVRLVDQARADIQINPPPSEEPSKSFIPEALFWAARFRFEELRLLGDYPWLPSYVRLFLGRCDLFAIEAEVSCYPVITLYESGVVLIELRFISPNHPVYIRDFVQKYVNLYAIRFLLLRIPLGLARLISRAEVRKAYENGLLSRRWHVFRRHRLLDRTLAETATVLSDSEFSFELVAVGRGTEENSHDTLASFALNIVDAIGYVLSGQRSDIGSLFLGYRPALGRGDDWTGRPHVYLVRHADQAETAQENEERHKIDLGWIMARAWSRSAHARGADHLPSNRRNFGDYGFYFNSAISLTVWGRQGLARAEQWRDLNRGHLIYGLQIIVEMIEYGYMLHLRYLQLASGHGTPDHVLAAKRELILVRQAMTRFSRYGELRELLRSCWDTLGVPELREVISEALAVRESETALGESRGTDQRNRLLTFAFGLAAVPSVAGEVVQPLWRYLGWWRPATDEAFTLLTIGVSVGLVTGLIRIWEAWLVRSR